MPSGARKTRKNISWNYKVASHSPSLLVLELALYFFSEKGNGVSCTIIFLHIEKNEFLMEILQSFPSTSTTATEQHKLKNHYHRAGFIGSAPSVSINTFRMLLWIFLSFEFLCSLACSLFSMYFLYSSFFCKK